jgi:hypothetical protein
MDKLTIADLEFIEIDEESAISMIRKYAVNYAGQSHYEQLGASCVMSVVNTVDIVIGSAEYLDGEFVMSDQIHVERLPSWFIANKEYKCDENVLLFLWQIILRGKLMSCTVGSKNLKRQISIQHSRQLGIRRHVKS